MPNSPSRNEKSLDIGYDVKYSGTKIHLDSIGALASDRVPKPNLLSRPALKYVGKEEPSVEKRIDNDGGN